MTREPDEALLWLARAGSDVRAAYAYGVARGLIDPDTCPPHRPGTFEGIDTIRGWLDEAGVVAAYDRDQDARATPFTCPDWCTVEHAERVIRPDADPCRHARALVDLPGVSVSVIAWETPEDGTDPPEVWGHIGVDGDDVHLGDAATLRRYAAALLNAADDLDTLDLP